MKTTIARTTMTIATCMRMGEHTHHQDQSMIPHSLSTMKTIVSSPVKPIPDAVAEAVDDE